MTVDLDATKFKKHGRSFTFSFKGASKAECSIDSTQAVGDSLVLSTDFNKCGIVVSTDAGTIAYKQTLYVTYGMNPNSNLVFRQERITFEVECLKKSSATIELAGDGHVNVSSLEEQTVSQCKITLF